MFSSPPRYLLNTLISCENIIRPSKCTIIRHVFVQNYILQYPVLLYLILTFLNFKFLILKCRPFVDDDTI